jgi:hypothetical protein
MTQPGILFGALLATVQMAVEFNRKKERDRG